MTVLLSIGSSGNSAIRRPSFVSSPRSFKEPSAYNCSNARINASAGGRSMKSKWRRSFIPKLFNISTTFPILVRRISGMVFGSSSCWNDQAVKRRKHFPGCVRPARPALWFAAACDIGVTTKLSIPERALYVFCLLNPQSTTYVIPSIVKLVSAIFVARTTFLDPFGVASKIFACWSDGRLA